MAQSASASASLHALRALSVERDLVRLHHESARVNRTAGQGHRAGVQCEHPAAGRAGKVMVVSPTTGLVQGFAVQGKRVDAALVTQQFQGAVHGGDADPRRPSLSPLQHVTDCEWPLGTVQNARDHVTLAGAALGGHRPYGSRPTCLAWNSRPPSAAGGEEGSSQRRLGFVICSGSMALPSALASTWLGGWGNTPACGADAVEAGIEETGIEETGIEEAGAALAAAGLTGARPAGMDAVSEALAGLSAAPSTLQERQR